MQAQNWVIDFRGEGRANMYRVAHTVMAATSRYQELLIVDTFGFGRALFIDGVPQSATSDEYIYHEALVHPALVAHHAPKSVFIVGGGEGAVLREVLKCNTVERVVMVDIDEMMVDLAKTHLSEWHQGAFEDTRVQLVIDDARTYLAGTQETFDCILVDVPDPVAGSPAALLFTTEFCALSKSRLNEGGTFAMQAETTDHGAYTAHVSIIKTLQQSFNVVLPYQTTIPFYGLPWGFAVASDQRIQERFATITLEQTLHERHCSDLKFYDAESHLHMFSLPKHLRKAIADPNTGTLIRDDQILVLKWDSHS